MHATPSYPTPPHSTGPRRGPSPISNHQHGNTANRRASTTPSSVFCGDSNASTTSSRAYRAAARVMAHVKADATGHAVLSNGGGGVEVEEKTKQQQRTGLECIAPLVCSVEETPEPIPTTFKIERGEVTYRNRFLRSETYRKNSERDRIMVSEFGTVAMPDPCKNFFQRFLSRFEMIGPDVIKDDPSDECSVSVALCCGLLSLQLKYIKVDWSKFVAVNGATAHPHYDPDGTAYNMGNSYGSKAMSENYVVFIEQPIKMDLLKIITSKLRRKAVSDAIYWDPTQDTVFHLVDKHTGQASAVRYHTKAISTFHQINAYEEDGFLMLDMCCADNGEAINNYLIQNMRKSGEALDQVYNTTSTVFPRRFILPLAVTDDTPSDQNLNTRPDSPATCVKTAPNKVWCEHEDLHGDDLHGHGGLEFPQINYAAHNARPYRYFYGCGFRHLVGDSLLKVDLKDKSLKPVFVASPDAVDEDDGVILSVVLTPSQDKATFLLVLDAKTYQEMGRANVPVNIPYGFHGAFNPTA
ncbi:hypothetical protein CRUP_021435 [Coryphaenoides rupestris]|nr:hypothetical protein CRUP_021435 [Coryphaenoides rupestris]